MAEISSRTCIISLPGSCSPVDLDQSTLGTIHKYRHSLFATGLIVYNIACVIVTITLQF